MSANWYQLGTQNAVSGQKISYLSEHTKACSEYLITPDSVAYQQGWQVGIVKFCTAQSAWQFGLSRRSYQNTCSDSAAKHFLPAYRLAKKVLAKRAAINEHRSDLRRLLRYSLSDKLTDEQRADITFARLDLKMELNFLEMDLRRLEHQAVNLGLY